MNWNEMVLPSLNEWSLVNAENTKFNTSCSGVSLIGGYGVLGKGAYMDKILSGLPKHSMMRI
jgi:hypothetical protein